MIGSLECKSGDVLDNVSQAIMEQGTEFLRVTRIFEREEIVHWIHLGKVQRLVWKRDGSI
jgi:hypothetical protein